MQFHLTLASGNTKTGPIPVSTISSESCPPSCPLQGQGCYAEMGPLALHWRAVTLGKRGSSFKDFLVAVRRLPMSLWRYGQAGDLPGYGEDINDEELSELAVANRRRKVIAFTHKPLTEKNLASIRKAERLGFHINASADTLAEVDELLAHDISVVTVLPSSYGKKNTETLHDYRQRLSKLPRTTPKGAKIAICPATYTDTTCQMCGVCANRRPNMMVIGFPAHGTRSRRVDENLDARAMEHAHVPLETTRP